MPKPVELEACSQDIIIEPANHLDIPRISELNRQLNLELPGFEDDRYDQESWISEEIGNENFFVLKEGAFVVGAISIIPSENELFIQTIAVDKDVHGKGL